MTQGIEEAVLEPGEYLRVGMWVLDAHVEMRTRWIEPISRGDAPANVPPVEQGDVLYRLVLDVQVDDGDGEHGMAGELATPWLWDLKDMRKQAAMLACLLVRWEEFVEQSNEYVMLDGRADLAALFDRAVERFRLASGVSE